MGQRAITRFRGARWAGAVAVAVAISAVGAAAASAAGRVEHGAASRGCYPKGSYTIAQDNAGRFYSSGGGSNRQWYVCAFKEATPRRLPHGRNPEAPSPSGPSTKVASRYVAFVLQGFPGFCVGGGLAPSAVWVVDMVTGQRTFSETLTGGEQFPAPGDDLVLKPDGSVAWVTSDACSGATIVSVNRHDSTGTAVVASGPNIDPYSLAADGSWALLDRRRDAAVGPVSLTRVASERAMTPSRRLLWVTGGVVAAVLAVSAAAAVAASAGGRAWHRSASLGCYPKGSTTIAQDKVGRFYFYSTARGWWYCAFSHPWPHSLRGYRNPDGPGPEGSTATLSGRYLAFVAPSGSKPDVALVVVVDMVAGRKTFNGLNYAGQPSEIGNPPRRLVLKPDGSVAWIDKGQWYVRYVHRHDSTGTTIVDSGTGIDPNSLAAGGAYLYWTNAGAPRSAPFH